MKNTLKILIVCCVLGFVGIALAFKPETTPERTKALKDNSSFAIVELFTSEGCSSCPPADQLLGNIVEKARAQKKRVYGLAFHVDYWDNLGWKDIYSSAAFSQRQRSYARAMRSNSVYTPEMMVNGKVGFVGSNGSRANSTIQNALNKPASVSVALSDIVMAGKGQVKVAYSLGSMPSNTVLNLAVVERGVVRHIKRGENSGLTMHHENVVRTFRTVKPHQLNGTATLQLPDDVDVKKASVVVYVQDENSMQVLGAQGKDL